MTDIGAIVVLSLFPNSTSYSVSLFCFVFSWQNCNKYVTILCVVQLHFCSCGFRNKNRASTLPVCRLYCKGSRAKVTFTCRKRRTNESKWGGRFSTGSESRNISPPVYDWNSVENRCKTDQPTAALRTFSSVYPGEKSTGHSYIMTLYFELFMCTDKFPEVPWRIVFMHVKIITKSCL